MNLKITFVKVLPEYTAEEKQEYLNGIKQIWLIKKHIGANKGAINLNLDNKEVQRLYLQLSKNGWIWVLKDICFRELKEKS